MEKHTKSFDILQIAKDFVNAVGSRKTFDEISAFYHPDVMQIEYPNQVAKTVRVRTLPDLEQASKRGLNVLNNERYEIINSYVCNNTVIIEAIWQATRAVDIGQTPQGNRMKAYFTQFFEFKDGKIFRQRNYDCFENFGNSQYETNNDKALNHESTGYC